MVEHKIDIKDIRHFLIHNIPNFFVDKNVYDKIKITQNFCVYLNRYYRTYTIDIVLDCLYIKIPYMWKLMYLKEYRKKFSAWLSEYLKSIISEKIKINIIYLNVF